MSNRLAATFCTLMLIFTPALTAPIPAFAHEDHARVSIPVKPGAVIGRMKRGNEVVLTYDTKLMTKEGALSYARDDCADFGMSLTKLTYKKPSGQIGSAVFICK